MIIEAACLAMAVYHEGRSEPVDAQMAIAQVVINRAAHPDFPSTICGVVKEHRSPVSRPWACQFSFYCDGKSDEPTDETSRQTLMRGQRLRQWPKRLSQGQLWVLGQPTTIRRPSSLCGGII